MEALIEAGVECTVFFYNPNIHPKREYEQRKAENIAYAKAHGIEFIDADYDMDNWFERVKGLENEPERGARCTKCFDMRFERSALYAYEHGFHVMTSSLGISRWKDLEQVNAAGERAASKYPDLLYWTINWRKGGGTQRNIAIAKREKFYKQEYCGCVYSLRDMNAQRRRTGREEIKIGELHYGFDEDSQG